MGRPQGFKPGSAFALVIATPNDIYTNPWNTALTQVINFSFSNSIDMQMFFQLGGNIGIYPFYANTGPITSAKDISWANLIDTVGTSYYTYANLVTGGNVVMTEKFAAGDYSANYLKIWSETFRANSSIVVTTLFDDASVDPQIDDPVSVVDVRTSLFYYRSIFPITSPTITTTVLKGLSPI